MLDCERQAMKSLSKEQLIYLIEQLLHNQESIRTICSEVSKKHMCSDEAVLRIGAGLYDMTTINTRTLPAYIDMKLGKITPEEFRSIFSWLIRRIG